MRDNHSQNKTASSWHARGDLDQISLDRMQNAAPWSHQNWAISKGSHNTYSVLLNAFSHKLAPVIWKLLAVSLHAAIDLLSQINCTCTAASHSHSMSRGILCWSWTLQTGVHCLNPSYATEQLQCSFQFWFLDNLNILHYSGTVHTSTLNPLSLIHGNTEFPHFPDYKQQLRLC